MKFELFGKWLLVAAICLFAVGCQQLSDDVLAEDEKGTLKVKTRSAAGGEVAYPLTLYVFSSDGDCVDTQLIENGDETVQLRLAKGDYRVVAVSSCKDAYVASTIEDWEDVVELPGDGGADIPLVMGKADVKIGTDTKGKLEIVLTNAVTSIDVALSAIPSDVTEVVVTMSSFYSSVNLKGEYVGADYSLRLPCSLDTSTRWSTKTRYLFPGSGEETVLSIWMKKKNGEEATYGYTWKGSPESNQPYHLQGNYSDGLILNGSFIWTAWNEAKDVEFQFGAVSSSAEEDTEDKDEPDVDLSGLPEIGSIWNGTIMADIIEADESGADVLLLSLDEWDATVSQVDDVIFGYTINGISDWRLPTHEEAATLRSKFSGDARVELNERIAEYDPELYGLANGDKERYLCLKDGKLYSFQFIAGTGTTVAGEKRSYYVRLVKSYHIDF